MSVERIASAPTHLDSSSVSCLAPSRMWAFFASKIGGSAWIRGLGGTVGTLHEKEASHLRRFHLSHTKDYRKGT